MAQSVLMSPRTFLRRFIEATGVPPEQSLIAERVTDTQRQLESSGMQVEDIATRVEFDSAQVLRHHFRARLGLAPQDYRSMFSEPRCALAGLQFSPGHDVDGDRRQAVGGAGGQQQNCR